MPLNTLPPLRGYALAYPKPAAEVLLVSDKADPVLAVWRYGLGRAAAFTADLRGRWGKAWVQWEEFSKFASQLVRWVQRKSPHQNVWMNVATRNSKSHITVDLYGDREEFVNNAQVIGTVSINGQASMPLAFEQTAPGRYEGNYAFDGIGEYLITVSGRDSRDEAIGPRTMAFAVPYSAEYIPRPPNLRLLRKLADLTGGQVLHVADASDTLGELFQAAGDGHRPPRHLWYFLIVAALMLFFFDIAARYLPPASQWLDRLGGRFPLARRLATSRPKSSTLALGGRAAAAVAAQARETESVGGHPLPRGELYMARLRRRNPSR